MRHFDTAVDETLRMYPPAWIGPRRSVESFEVCGVRVPAGVNVNYCSWASHHLAEVFPEPSQFRPSRVAPERRVSIRQMPTLSPQGGMPMIVRER
jgi:cytochrome P450